MAEAAQLIPAEVGTETTQLVESVEQLTHRAGSMEIQSQEDVTAAGDLLKALREREKELTEHRMSATRPLDDTKKRIMGWFKGPLDLISSTSKDLKGRVNQYLAAEENKRRKAAEAERKRVERLAAERAKRAEAKGDVDRAEEIRQEAETEAELAGSAIAAPVKTEGVHTRTTYSARVTDKKAFLKAIVDGHPLAHVDLVKENTAELNKMARAMKTNLNIPGVTVVEDKQVVAR